MLYATLLSLFKLVEQVYIVKSSSHQKNAVGLVCVSLTSAPTFGENRGGDSGVFSLHLCNQVSYTHQHGPKEEETLLVPRGQGDLQNQAAIFVLQGDICKQETKHI